MKVFLIPADPRERIREMDAPGDDDVDGGFARWCNNLLGGYLELVTLRAFTRSGLLMWVDTDAKAKRCPPNVRATRIALLGSRDFIAGEAVLTGSKGPETADAPLDLETLNEIVDAFMTVPQPSHVDDV